VRVAQPEQEGTSSAGDAATAALAAAKSTPSSTLIAARVAVLVLAAAAAVTAFHAGRSGGRPISSAEARYACPMHREATSGAPGQCPICGMALQPLVPAEPAADAPPVLQQGAIDVVRRRVFSYEVRAPASFRPDGTIEAAFFDDDLAALSPEERGEFHPASDPGAAVPVRLSSAPPSTWDASTSLVRFQPEKSAPAPQAPMPGWVQLPTRQRPTLVVPSSALLWSDEGPYVLGTEDARTFRRRPIRLGKDLYGFASVVFGLREEERIVARGAFFLDRDRGEVIPARALPKP
jgi:hypothetical protein